MGVEVLDQLPGGEGREPPPMKRTKPYVAEATDRSTGAMLMTAVVTRVLLRPTTIPDAMVAPMTTPGCRRRSR